MSFLTNSYFYIVPSVYTSGIGSDGDMDIYGGGTSTSGQPSGLGTNAMELSGTSYVCQLTGGQIIPADSDWTFSLFSNISDFHNSWMIGWNISESDNQGRVEYTTSAGGTIHKLALQFTDQDGNFTDVTVVVTGVYSIDVWHLVGVTYEMSSGTLSLFIDGSLSGDNGGSSATSGLSTVTTYVFFNVSAEAYEGRATEMVTRNVALSLSEFDTLYASGNGLTADNVQAGTILVYYNGQDTSAPITNIAIP